MARCLAYLESQGIGPLELATMSLGDTAAIAKQLAFEMNIPYGGYLDEAVDTWLQGAREERDLLQRARGVYGSDLEWRLLSRIRASDRYACESQYGVNKIFGATARGRS